MRMKDHIVINEMRTNFGKLNTRIFAGFSALLIVAVSTLGFISLDKQDAQAANPILTIASANNPTPPANAIYVNPAVSSGGSGTISSPLNTIAAAVSKATSGGTIVLRGGTYREGPIGIHKKLTLQAYPGEQAWLDGSNIIDNWVANSAGGYRIDNSPSSGLCKNLCVQDPSQVDAARNTMSSSPQMVFVDDVPLKEVSSSAQATSGNNFYFDKATNSLYIGVNPTGKKVEVTVRRKALEFSQASSGSSIFGIGVRRYGSTLNTNKVDDGWNFAAVQISGNSGGTWITGITIENSTFTQNASKGLYLGYANTSRIANNNFESNGGNGFDINSADSIAVINNHIVSNNTEKFNTINGTYAVIAGSKMVRLTNSSIKENIVENNDGEGFWCDLECINVKYYSNIIRNNTGRGIFYEVSTGATIASNVISNNSMGIAIHGPNSKIYNNTLYKNGEGIGIFEDDRTPSNDPYSDNRANSIVNNIIYGTNAPATAKNVFGQSYKLLDVFGPTQYPDTVAPNQMVTTLDYNSYYREGTAAPAHVFGLSGKGAYQNFATYAAAKATLNAYGFESNGYASDNGANEVLFNDASIGNFGLKFGSTAKASAKLLNTSNDSYIAADLGINPNSPIDRGAIKWPGKLNDIVATTSTTQAPTTSKALTTTTTQTPATTTTKLVTTTTTLPPSTSTTKMPTTSTTRPITTTSQPPVIVQSNILAMNKMKIDHDLLSIKQLSFKSNIIYARAYFKSSGFLYMAADVTATIQYDGTYSITRMNLLFSFGPFTY